VSGGELVALGAAVFVVALLYSSVGHAGASGYIAVMALCSVPAVQIKPIALMPIKDLESPTF
jgi:hypothetical protein